MNFSLPKLNLSRKDWQRRDWLILLGAAVVLIAIPLTVVLLRRYQETRIRAEENAQIVPGSVKVTNLHAHGFTVSWATVGETGGGVLWGPAGQPLAQTAYDDRAVDGVAAISSTHHVTLPFPPGSDETHPLFEEPEQVFDFKILSGDGRLYGGTFDNVFSVIDVSEDAGPIQVTTGPELYHPPLYTSKSLTAPLYMRGWPSFPGKREWSTIHISNSTSETANVTLTFVGVNESGNQVEPQVVTKEILPNREYNSHGDDDLDARLGSLGNFRGYLKIDSDQPLFGMLRQISTEDKGADSFRRDEPLSLPTDTPILSQELSSTKLVVPLFVQNWHTTMENHKQWGEIILNNSGEGVAEFSITFMDENGEGFTVGPKTLAAGSSYSSYDDSDLDGLGTFAGFATVESTQPLSGYVRDLFVEGGTKQGAVDALTDAAAVPDTRQFASRSLAWPAGFD